MSELNPTALWPPIGWDTALWEPDYSGAGRAARRGGTYRAAIPADIADLEVRLPGAAHAELTDAAEAVARFDTEMGGEIAPFAAVLLRTESASSSQIEQLTASARAVALAELGDTSRRNASAIVANTRAMQAAIALADRLDGAAILSMHHALIGDEHPHIPGGQWRQDAVWIGGASPLVAEFVPPVYERVAPAIADLERFLLREDIPVLLHAAVAHAQFETIHPFPDGNGRTGRALLHAMLRGKGLTRSVTVPISSGLLVAPETYFAALTAYRAGDIEPICRTLAAAAFRAVDNGRELVKNLRQIRQGWAEQRIARRGSAAARILDELATHPVMDTAFARRELGISESAAHRAFAALEAAGVVREFSGMRRNRCWRSDEVLSELDDFAARAGRRR